MTRGADGLYVHREAVDNAIGTWNPAWGKQPEIQRGPTVRPKQPKHHVHLVACPNVCREPTMTRGPDDAVYACAVCGAQMSLSRVKPGPKPQSTSIHPGERYGRLVVLSLERGAKSLRAVVRCDCGTIKTVWAKSLRAGQTKSCGCLVHEQRNGADHPWRRSYKGRGTDAGP